MGSKSFQPQPHPEASQSLLGPQTSEYLLAGFLFGLAFPIIASAIKLAGLNLPLNFPNLLAVQQSEPLLWIIDTAPVFLGLLAAYAGRRQDALAQTNDELQKREKELTAIQGNLEQIVDERTRELEERTIRMRSSVYFTRQLSEIRDLPSLLTKTVDLVTLHFGHYYTGLFLLEDNGKDAVLRARSSPAGQPMPEEGYTVAVGGQSIVGQVAERGKLYVSQASPESLEHLTSDLEIPGSQSKIALPLIVRGKVIGVLDIHSDAAQAFDQSQAEVLQLLADQVATSIENARLLSQSKIVVEQLETLTIQQTQSAWQEYLRNRKLVYEFTPTGVKSNATTIEPQDGRGLQIPLILRGQQIGTISLQRKDGRNWKPAERDLANKVAAQAALAVENGRLLEETRQRALYEQTVNQITTRFSRSMDVDSLLQIAVREIAALPDVAEASVILKPSVEDK
jgi:GAF domain-containing protein